MLNLEQMLSSTNFKKVCNDLSQQAMAIQLVRFTIQACIIFFLSSVADVHCQVMMAVSMPTSFAGERTICPLSVGSESHIPIPPRVQEALIANDSRAEVVLCRMDAVADF